MYRWVESGLAAYEPWKEYLSRSSPCRDKSAVNPDKPIVKCSAGAYSYMDHGIATSDLKLHEDSVISC